jgi:hypothetical protein
MSKARNLRRIDLYCPEYETEAVLLVQEKHESGPLLAVHYERGGYEGRQDFAASIPPEWGDEDLIEMIFLTWPRMPGRYWPTWELSSRDYASPTLLKYWKGERAG